MSNVLLNSAFSIFILLQISWLPAPALGSTEVVAQYPNDLQLFDDGVGPETQTIRRGYSFLEQGVNFKFYKNGQLTFTANGINEERLEQTGCTASDLFAFLLHGWRETCEVEWMKLLIAKLTTHRGGCIICVDYGIVSLDAYVRLLRKFNMLTAIMTNKVDYIQSQGVDPNRMYMFGFSFGGQLAVAIGNYIGPNKVKEIDTCDMAGPGFDFKLATLDHRNAAENVQCIHTSRDKGTKSYECHQNWRMGNCGVTQDAAESPPKGNHGLCPYFYISSFDHPFYAVEQPRQCAARRPALSWPDNFQMGYMEPRKSLVTGELFAITSDAYPFNNLNKQVTLNDTLEGPFFDQPRFRGNPFANTIQRVRQRWREKRFGWSFPV